jgi:hypothetical protein
MVFLILIVAAYVRFPGPIVYDNRNIYQVLSGVERTYDDALEDFALWAIVIIFKTKKSPGVEPWAFNGLASIYVKRSATVLHGESII